MKIIEQNKFKINGEEFNLKIATHNDMVGEIIEVKEKELPLMIYGECDQ